MTITDSSSPLRLAEVDRLVAAIDRFNASVASPTEGSAVPPLAELLPLLEQVRRHLEDVPKDASRSTPPMLSAFQTQRNAFEADRYSSIEDRRDRLTRLLRMTDEVAAELVEAISADVGGRAASVTHLTDVGMTRGQIAHNLEHLAEWMAPRDVPSNPHLPPGRSVILPQPVGVVGIVAPWNYPYLLSVGASIGALAAGNRVMIKPSEQTPRFSELLAQTVPRYFDSSELTVVTGNADVGKAFASLPFNHLLFTGGTQIGRSVAAAAANLTPVTLELGGKSPAIINADCDFDAVAGRILLPKLLNSGQTCIAPDYLAVPVGKEASIIAVLKAGVSKMYPQIAGNPEYTAIVNDRHLGRIQALLSDARQKGATIVPLHVEGEEVDSASRRMPPLAALNVTEDMEIMRQEIFGPVLPIVSYDSLDSMIEYINRGPPPLSLYWFGKNEADRDNVLRNAMAGGVSINDCIWHFAQEDLPFGGVGESGTGRYHGVYGFETFSNLKGVFHSGTP